MSYAPWLSVVLLKHCQTVQLHAWTSAPASLVSAGLVTTPWISPPGALVLTTLTDESEPAGNDASEMFALRLVTSNRSSPLKIQVPDSELVPNGRCTL